MRRHLSWFVILGAAVALVLALPGLRTPPAPAQSTATLHRRDAGATGNGTDGGNIGVAFSRAEDPRGVIRGALGAVHQSAIVAMYTFTDRDLAAALVAAQRRGARVQVYLDRSQAAQQASVARSLVAAGVPVRISSNSHIMHNKFAVLDGATVLTGSYNWTIAASQDNDENLLRITRPEVAQRYTERFQELWEDWDPALTASLKSPRGPEEHPERN